MAGACRETGGPNKRGRAVTEQRPAAAMADAIRAEKAAFRARLRAELNGVTAEERQAASAFACARLREQPLWRRARRLLFYAALPDELDLWPLVEETLGEGRTVALPRFLVESGCYGVAVLRNPKRDLVRGQMGIL